MHIYLGLSSNLLSKIIKICNFSLHFLGDGCTKVSWPLTLKSIPTSCAYWSRPDQYLINVTRWRHKPKSIPMNQALCSVRRIKPRASLDIVCVCVCVRVRVRAKEEEDTVRPVNFKGLAVRPCSNVFLSHKFLCSVLIWLVIYTVWDIYQLGSKVVHCSDRKHLNAVAQCNSITK